MGTRCSGPGLRLQTWASLGKRDLQTVSTISTRGLSGPVGHSPDGTWVIWGVFTLPRSCTVVALKHICKSIDTSPF